MALADVQLDDKYLRDGGRVYVSGIQALVRLLIMQRERDTAIGLNTAGFVSGYRGSPLGGFDKALWKAKAVLERQHIRFQPGLNEDLGATAVWGSQQVNMFEAARYDGVFGLWYGKGPGVDRTGDVFKHANAAGTSRYGGVLAVAGDDHGCKSSTLPHQSEFAFMDAMMPVLNPAGVQEILDLGLLGFALSRYSGCWVGFKTIAENVDSSASVSVDPGRTHIELPKDFELPSDGLHIRWPDKPLEQEFRLQKHKLYAAIAFARANKLNRIVVDSTAPRFGIITTGKSYLDVLQALEDLGIDQQLATQIGLRVLKVGMSWPLDREGIRRFAEGLEEVLVVEEKRAVIENQLKEQLYNWRADVRPRVVGKFDEDESWVLPSTGELTPARVARVIAQRIGQFFTSTQIRQRLMFLESKEAALERLPQSIERVPHYCSGCPHNTSTRVPEGSRAMGGIGCHYMATWMDRGTETFTQMGGEGVPWVGQAPFTGTTHVFQNLGDGTYFHSGVLAVRAAVAAGVNITYKILYNEAVAMTGGQPVDGMLSVAQLTHQLQSEGVKRICVVSDDPGKYDSGGGFAQGVTVHHRDELDRLQLELREFPGVSVIVYDQTCAAEKRRRRKRGAYPDPAHRVVINEAVCEGCGDCGTQSNCLSVIPVETEFGRKRAIDQHACNKDLSCLKGFCPSFVSVSGGRLRKPTTSTPPPPLPRAPRIPDCGDPYGIAITGVGGTGVVTLSALLGMAAHLEGKGCTVLDMTGLAQKYGAVVSHVRICEQPEALHAPRISAGRAKVLLGCDLVVAAGVEALSKCSPGETHAVVNDHASMTAAFLRQPDLNFPGATLRRSIDGATGGQSEFIDATDLGRTLVGDPVSANLLLLGFAYQRGLVPVSAQAIERALEINAVAVQENKTAFDWGRRLAEDPQTLEALTGTRRARPLMPTDLETLTASRATHLTAYQDAKLATRYRTLVERVRAVEQCAAPGRETLSLAVAQGYAKLLAYKDEYEVARLLTDPGFNRRVDEQFEGDYAVSYHLSPPFSGIDPNTGRPRKRRFGPWLARPLGWLAALKGIRGTRVDPFAYTSERRLERRLIVDYEQTVGLLLGTLSAENHALAVELAALPNEVRGYGPVKLERVRRMEERKKALIAKLDQPPKQQAA